MVSPRPRVGDLVVVRINPNAAAILIVAMGADELLHSPYDTVEKAIYSARQMAATSSVDVWHRTSATTFELIASYRRDIGSHTHRTTGLKSPLELNRPA